MNPILDVQTDNKSQFRTSGFCFAGRNCPCESADTDCYISLASTPEDARLAGYQSGLHEGKRAERKDMISWLDSLQLTEEEIVSIIGRAGQSHKFPEQLRALVLCQIEKIQRSLKEESEK